MKILITGSSSGIGKAIAEKYLKEGHEVVGLDTQNATIIDKNYRHILCDVRENLPEESGVNVVVTSAGIQLPDEETVDVNLNGTIRTVEKYAFQPAIRSVLTIASASGTTGSEFPRYAASKGGVIAYTKNVALRLSEYGATANSLSPGGVYTRSNAVVLDDPALKEEALNESLLHKWATVEEIAEFAYFLTVVNKSMTGQDVLVDNGEAVKSNFVWKE